MNEFCLNFADLADVADSDGLESFLIDLPRQFNDFYPQYQKVCDQSIFKEENELTDNQFGEMNDFKELDNILPLIQYREYDQNNPKNIKRSKNFYFYIV